MEMGTVPFPQAARQGRNEFADNAAPHFFGHRERLRECMLAAGTENLPDYELLEVILFAARARGDVKPVAKALLAHFGGLAAVLTAEPDALAATRLNLAGIAAIKVAREAALRLMRTELQEQPVVNSWDRLIDYCTAHVAHNQVEEFRSSFSTGNTC
jgi:DNA repair protein RadC